MKGKTQPLIAYGTATALVPTAMLFESVNLLFVVPLITGLVCLLWGNCQATQTQQKRRSVVGGFVCLVAWVAPFVITDAANAPGRPIDIILPNGFRGDFQIIKDSKNGQDLVIRDGAYIFDIPPDGTLRVRSDAPFYRWHSGTMRYQDGTEVSAKDLGVTAGSIQTGESSWKGSTDFDGTTHRWYIP